MILADKILLTVKTSYSMFIYNGPMPSFVWDAPRQTVYDFTGLHSRAFRRQVGVRKVRK